MPDERELADQQARILAAEMDAVTKALGALDRALPTSSTVPDIPPGGDSRELTVLVLGTLEHTLEQSFRWTPWLAATLVTIILTVFSAVTPVVLEHVLDDPPNACSVQFENVNDALKAGIDEPAQLEQLSEEGCPISPVEVAEDIRSGRARPSK